MWFTDGNVVLEAEETQFRVHRGILALHSTVFKDMFEMPQPSEEPTVEGCPVVQLSDTAADVERLLNAVYNCLYNSPEKYTFPVMAALLRLGHKYDFARFRDDALSRLTSAFPTTLDGWDEKCHSRELPDLPHTEVGNLVIAALNLALELHLHTILPSIYCWVHESYIMEELLCIQDTISKDHLLQCALGYERSRKAATVTTFKWLNDVPYQNCISPKGCRERVKELKVKYLGLFGAEDVTGLTEWNAKWEDRLCNSCGEKAEDAHDQGRLKYWNRIPGMFGLPEWKDLRNFD